MRYPAQQSANQNVSKQGGMSSQTIMKTTELLLVFFLGGGRIVVP